MEYYLAAATIGMWFYGLHYHKLARNKFATTKLGLVKDSKGIPLLRTPSMIHGNKEAAEYASKRFKQQQLDIRGKTISQTQRKQKMVEHAQEDRNDEFRRLYATAPHERNEYFSNLPEFYK